ncbi:MAG: DNA repair protein RecO [Verrucomicrobiota bacterium]
MDERATGLILRIRPLTETSLIVHWLTPDLGRVATVAKGARRQKSPFRGKLDLFYHADFSFQRSRRSELHNLREVVLRETHLSLRREIESVQQASYCAKLIEQTTETETPLPNIFGLAANFLAFLASRPPEPKTLFAFEMKLLSELGFQPDLSKEKLTIGAKVILERLLSFQWAEIPRLKLSPNQEIEIRHFLREFLSTNLGRTPHIRA